MTRPDPRQQAALSAAFAGAVDLSALARPATPAPPVPSSQYVVDVTEASFGEVVQTSAQLLVVVDLWSARSQGSATLSPVLARLAEEGRGTWLLARVDVDANPRIAQAFQVQAIPTTVALAGGQPVDAFTGVQPEDQLRAWITSLIDALRDRLPGIRAAEEAAGGPAPEPVDPRFVAAEELLELGDFAGARAAYQAILDAEPANADAASALAQTDFLARTTDLSDDAVEFADAHPDDVRAQCAAADLEVASNLASAAFDRLIATVRRAAGDDRTVAREHLLGLFALFPVDDEAVRTARRRLAAALY
ncbi:tetratricopeptide repeat protein [Nakamurella endophytica]|uniref:Co-chaperone YbbN n=1 Tax=Nakamurella endophytica TaxID=1748367 RepID=A0A917SQ19_9ACTN|nr:tetratricopeptide repeat protein [Nakamurella endophytica]GGL90640.1 co-chaperone YbbN [Nakamurella endophytica]